MGGIYGGLFTATEAAAISAFGSSLLVLYKKATWSHFILSIKDTCTQTTSIFFIAVSASILVGFLALTGMEPSLGGIVEDADVSLWLLMVMIAGVYLLLGMFLDPLGIMVLALTIGLNVFVIASVTKSSVAVYEIFMGVV